MEGPVWLLYFYYCHPVAPLKPMVEELMDASLKAGSTGSVLNCVSKFWNFAFKPLMSAFSAPDDLQAA
jgi:hypothetical protein